MHSCWGGGGEAPFRLKTKIKGRQICFDNNERLSVAQLDSIADEIEAVHLALQTLMFEILPAIPGAVTEVTEDGQLRT